MAKARMNIEDVRPELREAFARLPSMSLGNPVARWLMAKVIFPIVLARNAIERRIAGRKNFSDISVTVENLGTAQARVYVPSGPLSGAGLLWIHGGGMVIGSAAMNDNDCREYGAQLNSVVVSVEYRLAPKHPYPAAIDDCYAVWCWFQENAERLGVDPKRIAIAGQSAGGGLSAALCQRIQDTGGVQPAAQCLFYPMLDDRTAADKGLDEIEHIGWHNRNNRFGWGAYLAQPPGAAEVPPWGSPGRREDLSGQPPAWIGVGDLDLFLEENKSFAARLERAGCPAELRIIEGAPHGFDAVAFDAQVSKDFVASATAFLKKHLQA